MTENTRKVLLNALILTFLSGGAFADGIIAKKNFSILGDNKDEILANVLTSTTALVQAEAPPPVVTSTSTVLNSTGTVVSNSTGTINANFGNPFLPPITNPAFKNSAFPVTTNTIQQTVSQPPNQQPPPLVSSNTVSQSSSQLPSQQPNQVVASSQPAQIVLPPMSAARAGDEFVEYLNSKNFLFYSRERWQKMRSGLEREEQEKEEPQVSVSTMPKTTAQLPPGLSVELPYESQLTISGRKTIGFSLKSTIYEHEEAGTRQSTTAFDMTQELQVRIKGQVGRKVNTNVDFDDTNANKRDISVVYKGDKNEVVQDAAFGDITVALPSTEFVGYSKQLFGINLHTKYKGLESWGFFSQTKGLSEMKKFQGLSTTQRKVLNDTDYLPMKYYMAKFNNDVMQTGSLRVYLDDMNPIDNNVTTLTGKPTINVSDYLTPNASSNPSYTGDFDLLVPGQDYNVNYDLGIITIKKQIQPNYVIAVDYLKVGGGSTYSGQLKIVKDTNNTVGLTRELKTFYSLGDVQITRDNGKGNFVLQIQDPNNNNQVPANIINDDGTTKPTPQYSINSNQSNIFVDFDAGIFYFTPPDAQPPPFQNSLYTAVKEHKYTILVQYDHLQTGSIQLGRFDIVPQSEKITLDGVPLAKDKDYIIDYDVGLVTFLNKDRINANTDIEITYDYAPLGTGGGSTLVGTRSQLSLTKDITVGGSFIDNFAAKTTALPDIRSTPSSLMVWEGDAKISNVKIPLTPITLSLGGEYAESTQDPNVAEKALVDSMDGDKQEDAASMFMQSWQPAANPTADIGAPVNFYVTYANDTAVLSSEGDIGWSNESWMLHDINTTVSQTVQDQEQVLRIDYNLYRSNEMSIIQTISKVGADYSKKLSLETWIQGDGNNEQLEISYGKFNENADGHPNPDGTPKTEDLAHTGTLMPGEDVGWPYVLPDGTTSWINIIGHLDTEDLDGDGVLNTVDYPASPAPYTVLIDTAGVSYSAVTWKGWKMFRIPLNIADQSQWAAIKQIRLTIVKTPLTSNGAHTIRIGNITLVGNKWLDVSQPVVGSTFTISCVNNQEDPTYVPLINVQSYLNLTELTSTDAQNIKQQALALSYTTLFSSTEFDARDQFVQDAGGRMYDFSMYNNFNFYVNDQGQSGDTFFIQVGNDNNYFEYSTSSLAKGWQLITINQDSLGTSQSQIWSSTGSTPGIITVVGAPALNSISQIKVGVRSKAGSSGLFWLSEIHVTGSRTLQGAAWKATADLNCPGWFTAGAKRKSIDRNFQTFAAGIYNRDYLEDDGYLNLTRLSFLPLNTSLSKTRTITPAVVQNQSNLVSVLDQGEMITYTGAASTSPDLKKLFAPLIKIAPPFSALLPNIGGQYSRSIIDTQNINRLEDRETFTGTASYPFPIKLNSISPIKTGINIFPLSISGNYSLTNSIFKTYPSTRIIDTDNFLDLPTLEKYLDISKFDTWEVTQSYGGTAPFQPWKGFSLNPSYSISRVKERDAIFETDNVNREYPKSTAQNMGCTSDLRIFSWLDPKLSYNVTVTETYDLTFSTAVYNSNPYVASDIDMDWFGKEYFLGQNKIIDEVFSGQIPNNYNINISSGLTQLNLAYLFNQLINNYPDLVQMLATNTDQSQFTGVTSNTDQIIANKAALGQIFINTLSATRSIQFPSQDKVIERRSNGQIAWNLNMKDLINSKYTNSLGFSLAHAIADSDSYQNMPSSFNVINVFDNKSLWIRGNSLLPLDVATTGFAQINTIDERDDDRFSGKYNPFEAFNFKGRLAALKTLTANINYTDSKEWSYVTGTQKDSISILWPDLALNLNKWEQLFWLDKWLDNTSLNLRSQQKLSQTLGVSDSLSNSYGTDLRFTYKKKLDLSLGGTYANGQSRDFTTGVPLITAQNENTTLYAQTAMNIKKWRFSLRYDYSDNWQVDGTGKPTVDNFTHALTILANSDMSFPKGIPIPFTHRTLPLTNRLIFNSSLKLSYTSSGLDITQNTNNYNLTSSADYEISQNFRANAGVGLGYVQNRLEGDLNYYTMQATAGVTIQF